MLKESKSVRRVASDTRVAPPNVTYERWYCRPFPLDGRTEKLSGVLRYSGCTRICYPKSKMERNDEKVEPKVPSNRGEIRLVARVLDTRAINAHIHLPSEKRVHTSSTSSMFLPIDATIRWRVRGPTSPSLRTRKPIGQAPIRVLPLLGRFTLKITTEGSLKNTSQYNLEQYDVTIYLFWPKSSCLRLPRDADSVCWWSRR